MKEEPTTFPDKRSCKLKESYEKKINLWNQQQLHLLGSSLRGSHGFVTAPTASVYVWICSDILSWRSHMFNNNTDP